MEIVEDGEKRSEEKCVREYDKGSGDRDSVVKRRKPATDIETLHVVPILKYIFL